MATDPDRPLRDKTGRCTICGRAECRYPAGQTCFAIALEAQEESDGQGST